MRLSRKAKRYDDAILPGNFKDFQSLEEEDPLLDGVMTASLRREGSRVELAHLSMERQTPRKQSFAKLRSKAEDLTHRINYLDERLEIVDHDRRGMLIQIRSLPPYKDDRQIQFNEICIGRDRVVVKRIAFFRKEEVKQQVAMRLSEESLQRLLVDLRQVL